jgi:hypothetical protein
MVGTGNQGEQERAQAQEYVQSAPPLESDNQVWLQRGEISGPRATQPRILYLYRGHSETSSGGSLGLL